MHNASPPCGGPRDAHPGRGDAGADAFPVNSRGAYERAARITRNAAYQAAIAVAPVTTIGLVCINFAVGLIGSEDDLTSLINAGVLALGFLGAAIVRSRPRGMAHVLGVTALAQALAGLIALMAGGANWPGVVVALTAVFALLWLLSAWRFRKAAQEQVVAGQAFSSEPR
jgi:hypothetical protein